MYARAHFARFSSLSHAIYLIDYLSILCYVVPVERWARHTLLRLYTQHDLCIFLGQLWTALINGMSLVKRVSYHQCDVEHTQKNNCDDDDNDETKYTTKDGHSRERSNNHEIMRKFNNELPINFRCTYTLVTITIYEASGFCFKYFWCHIDVCVWFCWKLQFFVHIFNLLKRERLMVFLRFELECFILFNRIPCANTKPRGKPWRNGQL